MSKEAIQSVDNVWDALADTPEEAANLTLRSGLMDVIIRIVQNAGWTQRPRLGGGLTQSRINDLLRGRISKFFLDVLVNIASKLGKRVTVTLDAA